MVLVAVALLGAITHQTLAAWAPSGARRAPFSAASAQCTRPGSPMPSLFCTGHRTARRGRLSVLQGCTSSPTWNAIVIGRHLGLLDLKEDFVAIGLGLLPAYWVCWRRPLGDERGRTALL